MWLYGPWFKSGLRLLTHAISNLSPLIFCLCSGFRKHREARGSQKTDTSHKIRYQGRFECFENESIKAHRNSEQHWLSVTDTTSSKIKRAIKSYFFLLCFHLFSKVYSMSASVLMVVNFSFKRTYLLIKIIQEISYKHFHFNAHGESETTF